MCEITVLLLAFGTVEILLKIVLSHINGRLVHPTICRK